MFANVSTRTGWCASLSRGLLLAVPLLAPAQAHAGPADVVLTASELEQRLDAVTRRALGETRHPLPEPPWTAERLQGYLQALPPLRQGIGERMTLSFEQVLCCDVVALAQLRLGLLGQPDRERGDELLAWVDSWITHHLLILNNVEHGLDMARRWVEYKRGQMLFFDRREDQELLGLLEDLDRFLRTWCAVARVQWLADREARPRDEAEREQLREWLREARRDLPEKYRETPAGELKGYRGEVLDRVNAAALALQQRAAALLSELLPQRLQEISEKERQLRDRGRPGAQRRDLERARSRTSAALLASTDAAWKWVLRSVRLLALQTHCDRGYAGQGPRADGLQLPPRYDRLSRAYAAQVPEGLRRLRQSLDAIEKEMDRSEKLLPRVAEFVVLRGGEIVEALLDGLVDDLIDWMGALPHTQRTVKDQILRAVGFPQGKDRLAALTREELKGVERHLVMSYQEIREGFDRDTLYRLRQDLDLLEALLRNYSPRGLLRVGEPVWQGEPTERIGLADCRALPPAAAARAYVRLFEQIEQDWDAVSAEHARYLVRLNARISFHNRGTLRQ